MLRSKLKQIVVYKMATAEHNKLFSLSDKGSDFVLDFHCNPCEKEGNSIEAINFCVDCSEHFCLACTQQHTKFRATSGHNVVNGKLATTVGGASQSSGIMSSEVCREHTGEKITTFCADHDLVICNTCAAVDHRLCGGKSHITKVTNGSKNSKEIKKVQQDILKSLKALSHTKLSLQNLLTSADEEKKEHLKSNRDCTERLIKHARDLEKSAVDDVNGCHRTTTDKLRSNIISLDDAAMTIQSRLNNLDKAKVNNETQVFVDIKRGRQEVETVRQLKQNFTSAPAAKAMPEFVVKDDVNYFLNEVRCLGQFVEKKAYKATVYGDYDVGMNGDEYECCITGSCELPDGTILIADNNNNCMKKLDRSYKTTARLNMPPKPWGICQIGEDTVAVTLMNERKVQFVNVRGKLRMTRSFKVSTACRGIICSRSELFVACGGFQGNQCYAAEGPGFVAIYNMTGSLLRKIQIDRRGQQIFSTPRHIISTDNGNKLHVADKYAGVITFDRQGTVLSTFHEGLQESIGVCAVTDNNLLVCGDVSNNVLQISADGEMVAQLLGEANGVNEPWSLLFLRSSTRLVLTQSNSDKIKVFNLKM